MNISAQLALKSRTLLHGLLLGVLVLGKCAVFAAPAEAGQVSQVPVQTKQFADRPQLVAGQARASQDFDHFANVRNKEYGYTFQIPASWVRTKTDGGALLMYGKPGTGAEQAIIVLQIVRKSAVPSSNAVEELRKLHAQVKRQPEFEHLNDFRVPMVGRQAPFFLVRYRAEDETGKMVPYKHLHVVLDYGDNYFMLSYRAPVPVYAPYEKVFKHMVATYRFEGRLPVKAPKKRAPLATIGREKPVEVKAGWVHDHRYGYRIRVPKGWRAEKSDDDSVQIYPRSKRAGVFVVAMDLKRELDLHAWINLAEEKFAPQTSFMAKRVLNTNVEHPGTGLPGAPLVVREYEGHHMRKPVKSYVGYAVNGTRVYMIMSFIERRSRPTERRVIDVLQSFLFTGR